MVTLMLDQTQLEVVLSVTEHALSLRKQNVTMERSQIVKVQLTDDAWTWLRGVPDPGVFVPSAFAMGTWKSAGGKDFAIIRRRRPSVVIDLEGHDEFQRVIVTTRHGLALVKALRMDTGEEFADVVDIAAAPAKKKPRSAKPRPATV
ncbi:hypothetical protein ET475_03905 [Microbacterium protaetiae]|uniref:Uncharacterized protein n=1 Tax=Microbacterium protaetiae TaxID=2509458 RepID=A0A4P6EAQ4_9MICO|nr:hypothetical protein [Microbacterium protaetiae]QAY59220.1 hypothetical protein ET475_03905 [Microbacterium protaetiae]